MRGFLCFGLFRSGLGRNGREGGAEPTRWRARRRTFLTRLGGLFFAAILRLLDEDRKAGPFVLDEAVEILQPCRGKGLLELGNLLHRKPAQ